MNLQRVVGVVLIGVFVLWMAVSLVRSLRDLRQHRSRLRDLYDAARIALGLFSAGIMLYVALISRQITRTLLLLLALWVVAYLALTAFGMLLAARERREQRELDRPRHFHLD